MRHIPELELSQGERLVYCKDPIAASAEMAVLIIKPSNSVLNANSTKDNTHSIIRRFEQHGWELLALKLIAGDASITERLLAHYPQPFYDARSDDLRPELTAEEQNKLAHIWGKEALDYPVYHPLQIAAKHTADLQTLAHIWHAGRGIDNQLLDAGSSNGINTVTPQKHPAYGKRRLLLVKNNPQLPGMQPFFMVNGFTAELITKFSRQDEKIIIMAFGQQAGTHNLSYMREHVVGDTNPHHARPGSIRYDALHAAEYSGEHPIASADVVGIENNIVHLSDSPDDAARELRLWLPEVLWWPPTGSYAPDISLDTWERLRRQYLDGKLTAPRLKAADPDAGKLKPLSALPPSDTLPALSVNMMAGGSGGRFFGYELPEHLRNKLFAPLVPLDGKKYSFLELQLARLASANQHGNIKAVNIIANENTTATIQAVLEALRQRTPKLADTIGATTVLTRRGVPRIVPLAADLEAERKFVAYCEKHNKDSRQLARALATGAGTIVFDHGAVSAKPPGHLSVILHYIHHRLQTELLQGVEIAFFHIGEDTAAAPDPRFLWHAQSNGAVATIGLTASPRLDKGYLIDASGKLCLVETRQNLGVHAPYYLNTSRIVLNLKNLAAFLAGDVAAFMNLSEAQMRDAVTRKIISQLTPMLEVKPIHNYEQWAGQFSFVVGQVSEVFPSEYVVYDDTFPNILTFKTPQELQGILPIVQREYTPYLRYLQ